MPARYDAVVMGAGREGWSAGPVALATGAAAAAALARRVVVAGADPFQTWRVGSPGAIGERKAGG
jgi:hypothetical protein